MLYTKKPFALLATILIISCFCQCTPDEPTSKSTPPAKPAIKKTTFNADSALHFVQKQVDFGHRVPGSKEHKACADWLTNTLKKFTDTVYVQTGKVTAYTGEELPMYNIVGTFNPASDNRILLAAHWDTRHIAEKDPEKPKDPILGANDGASGVGVLLELARQLSMNKPNLGIDLMLFDVEDYGTAGKDNTYCLGSQYWSKQPHIKGYKADYGILLDMVGAGNAVFYQEGISMQFAPNLVKEVWTIAHELGYSSYFPFKRGMPITDDHYYVNTLAKIPMIDIIHLSEEGFGSFHHTHKDNMSVISKSTLKVVGNTLLTFLARQETTL